MDFLPIFMNIRERPCLVVGGGKVAARKVVLLNQAHARITVVSPELCDNLRELRESGQISYRAGKFRPADLTEQSLVIAATNDEGVNREISELCKARGLAM